MRVKVPPFRKIFLLWKTAPLVFFYRIAILVIPFQKLNSSFHWTLPGCPKPRITTSELGWCLDSLQRHLPILVNCWSLAAAGARIANKNGFESAIRMGIRNTPSGLKAHAWLICQGRIISGAKNHRFYTVTTILRAGEVITDLPPQETLPDGTVRFQNGIMP